MNIICKIFQHKYQIVQRFDLHVAKLKCKRCNCEFGINTNVQVLLPWDNELEQLHR